MSQTNFCYWYKIILLGPVFLSFRVNDSQYKKKYLGWKRSTLPDWQSWRTEIPNKTVLLHEYQESFCYSSQIVFLVSIDHIFRNCFCIVLISQIICFLLQKIEKICFMIGKVWFFIRICTLRKYSCEFIMVRIILFSRRLKNHSVGI